MQPDDQEEEIRQEDLEQLAQATSALIGQFSEAVGQPLGFESVLGEHQQKCDACVPVQELSELTATFQGEMAGLKEQKEKLLSQLEGEMLEREKMEVVMADCLAKLDRMEQRVIAKKKKKATVIS